MYFVNANATYVVLLPTGKGKGKKVKEKKSNEKKVKEKKSNEKKNRHILTHGIGCKEDDGTEISDESGTNLYDAFLYILSH